MRARAGVLFSQLQCCVDLHWNEEQQMYCDANVNEDGLSIFSEEV